MATANPLWGAPRIHGELQTLGIDISEPDGIAADRAGGRPPRFQQSPTFRQSRPGDELADSPLTPSSDSRLIRQDFPLDVNTTRPRVKEVRPSPMTKA